MEGWASYVVDRVCCLAGGGGETVAICAKGDILSLPNEQRTCAGSTTAARTGPTFLCQNRCTLEFSGIGCAVGESLRSCISEFKPWCLPKQYYPAVLHSFCSCCTSSSVGIPEFFLIIQVFVATDHPFGPNITHWGRRFHKMSVYISLPTVNKSRY